LAVPPYRDRVGWGKVGIEIQRGVEGSFSQLLLEANNQER